MATTNMEEFQKMKVADLKKELKDRGLPTTGLKDALLERLKTAQQGTDALETPVVADSSAAVDDNLEKTIDQLVKDTSPVQTAPSVNPTAPAKENIPAVTQKDADSSQETKKVVSLSTLSEADRLKARAEKFGGAVSETAKKQLRAERFGLPISSSAGSGNIASTPASASDLEKMKKRAERFGTVVSNKLSKVDEDDKKKKRMERFGNSVTSGDASGPKKVKLNSLDSDAEGALQKVKVDTLDSDAEARKKKRAERFGLT